MDNGYMEHQDAHCMGMDLLAVENMAASASSSPVLDVRSSYARCHGTNAVERPPRCDDIIRGISELGPFFQHIRLDMLSNVPWLCLFLFVLDI